MSLQRKFLLVISMVGVALLGSLGAVWWAFGMLEQEISAPFAETAGVLDALGHIKRQTEAQAAIINTGGVLATGAAEVREGEPTRGVRGPKFELAARQASGEEIAAFRGAHAGAMEWAEQIERSETAPARIGVSTWRNLRSRLEETSVLAERWFGEGDEGARMEAGRACFAVHELIEQTEMRVLANAKHAVTFGVTIRSMLRVWLLSVLGVGLLGAGLAVALLNRWVRRPVRVLREAAARIAQGDFEHRVPVLQRDEIGRLSAEVNHMTEMVLVMQDERVQRERLAAVGVMLRRIVHNVRNPLSGIRGLAEVTGLDMARGTPNRENMDLIVSTVDTFERWLSELLDATDPADIRPVEVGVRDWASGLVEVHRPQAQARGVTLCLEVEGAPEGASFDPKHLDHAASALISNAIEATPEGGRVWVSARSANEEGVWEVSVADEGAGVPPEMLTLIFEPHFTTKRHGNGLGLAMAMQVAKGHGGRLQVRNGDEVHPERRGASFVIQLPLRAVGAWGIPDRNPSE